ncbi:class I SAM-dependent methyltransferase [Paraburkholderia sp. MM5477-R1]|uniref:class I SAM-dependent methyltransferase n=1 Tax=Paraburkholderia sp. MM5477-R1 TaxID=2991062 RepID=UPI003D1981B4
MHKPIDIETIPSNELQQVKATYAKLCEDYIAHRSDGEYRDYVQSVIANNASLDRHVRAFEIYAPYIKRGMKVLDWGCRHAPDSCMLRTLYHDIDIYGCDICKDGQFAEFHEYAGLSFASLDHEFLLPYEDNQFDVVIGSGVLEHVAREQKSLDELWRVLKNDGLLIITFLPNRLSVTENACRVMKKYTGHNRLYSLSDAKRLFLRSGFVLEECGYHQVFPTFAKGIKGGGALNALANIGMKLNRPFERIPIVNAVSANLFFILRRVHEM